mmetsp:Transcript_8024/g.33768  ORF Transcript_8024/g.33768 Transcript_8024/m.33768 type:complete len:254 (-) Transcript_8024:317-1078(-)
MAVVHPGGQHDGLLVLQRLGELAGVGRGADQVRGAARPVRVVPPAHFQHLLPDLRPLRVRYATDGDLHPLHGHSAVAILLAFLSLSTFWGHCRGGAHGRCCGRRLVAPAVVKNLRCVSRPPAGLGSLCLRLRLVSAGSRCLCSRRWHAPVVVVDHLRGCRMRTRGLRRRREVGGDLEGGRRPSCTCDGLCRSRGLLGRLRRASHARRGQLDRLEADHRCSVRAQHYADSAPLLCPQGRRRTAAQDNARGVARR